MPAKGSNGFNCSPRRVRPSDHSTPARALPAPNLIGGTRVRAVLVAGSDLRGALDVSLLATADLLVAVDGGADALAAVGTVPHLLVGDLDSISLGARARLEAQGVEVLVLPVAKDVTDTEAALRLAVERGADDIVVFGALGGPRLDHLVGNLLLLASDLAGRTPRSPDRRAARSVSGWR